MTPEEKEIRELLMGFFKTELKVEKWLCLPNPMLGNISPCDFLSAGREKKLLRMVKDLLDGNVA